MNPFIMVDDKVYQMALPPREDAGKIYVPMALFLSTVGYVLPGEFSYERDAWTVRVRKNPYNITGIEVEEKLNGHLVRFITTKQFKSTDIASFIKDRWLSVTLYGGTLDSVQLASERKMGVVKRVVPFQFEEAAQVSFLLDRDLTDPQVYVDGGEVLITLRENRSSASVPLSANNNDRKEWLIDRIIIDPGHGGRHPGAVGPNGEKEKDLTLDIARRVKKLLKERHRLDVLMTREDDRFMGLKERTQFANSHDGKLFISIHINSNRSSRQRGFSTWVLGKEKTEQALQIAQKENSVIEFEDADKYQEYQDATYIINAIAQSSYLKESLELARMVNDALKKHTALIQWGKGVYQAGFYVLVGASMPCILVEIGFLSNSGDRRYLKVRSNKQKIAEALCESIMTFKSTYEKGIQ
jgi:N-acetylmuramoyl-L-alanine amidase